MDKRRLKEVKGGRVLRLKECEWSGVWVRDDYDRCCKSYGWDKQEEQNDESLLKGRRRVLINFRYQRV